jgi:hypothetical protein
MTGRPGLVARHIACVARRLFFAILLLSVAAFCGCGPSSNTCMRPQMITIPATLPGASITDVYLFPSPNVAANVVLAMNVHPLIPSGDGPSVVFDPNILFQFKVDNTGDFVEDLVIQFRCVGTGSNQAIQVIGPLPPYRPGTASVTADVPDPVQGTLNNPFTLSTGIHVFAGAREDPFFFDVNQFYSMLPDRANLLGPMFTNTNGVQVSTTPANPDLLQFTTFRPAARAQDFFKGLNVLSFVVELPRHMLGSQKIHLWATTSEPPPVAGCTLFTQVARQARPLATTVFPPVANMRQMANNTDNPKNDVSVLGTDVQNFMTIAAGRSAATNAAVKNIFVPDVLTADLSSQDRASYLGIETNGATGGKFGGRALSDDVVDIMFSILFGNTVAHLNLAPDDGRETPLLTSDNVSASAKHVQANFPYLGPPQ